MSADKSGVDELTDSFTHEEVVLEYKKLFELYKDLKSVHDEDQQKIYELKRNWETALAAESYLSQELEILTASQSTEIEKAQLRLQCEIEILKKKHSEVVSENNCLEQRIEEFIEKNDELERKLEELDRVPPKEATFASSGSMERELQLAKENLELLAKVDECRDKMTSSVMQIAEKERRIDILTEQVECLGENLQAKREEVEEKTQLLESAQERLMELRAELAMLKSEPENTNRKGNSLFAEVDDQRQQMKRILTAQKKHYLYMKKCYNESQQEIRRLKRENAAMAKEMQVCATIFLSADKRYKEKLNERIQQLLKQNEELERKLLWTQEKLIALSLDKGINWLDSMLAFCRNETEGLKEQVRSCLIQKGIIEEHLVKSQQDLAKWRFEALKSRRIIIDREALLEENNIDFKPIFINISEQDMDQAEPEIFKRSYANSNKTLMEQTMMEPKPITESSSNLAQAKCSVSMDSSPLIDDRTETVLIKTEKHLSTIGAPEFHMTPTSSRRGNSLDSITTENWPETNNIVPSITSEKSEDVPSNPEKCSFVKFAEDSTPHKSVLRTKTPFKKKREVYGDESEENGCYEIYEDSMCSAPTIKCKDVNMLIHTTNQTINSSENKPSHLSAYEDTICQTPDYYKDENEKSLLLSSNNISGIIPKDFQIYEDTICRLPTVKQNDVDPSKENVPIIKETSSSNNHIKSEKNNDSIFKDHSSSVLNEHNPKIPSPPQSILVKGRNILDDPNDKTVTFSPELTTEIKDDREFKSDDKILRNKSQVSVRRIVVKSNFNRK